MCEGPACYDVLFEPGAIGPLSLKNRILFPAMHLGYARGGEVNEHHRGFFVARARGGAALLMVGGCTVSPEAGGPNMLSLARDDFVSGMAGLAGLVHEGGAKVGAQLFHAGRYARADDIGCRPVAPSPIASRLTSEEPEALCAEGIAAIVRAHAEAARRAAEAGFDLVEIIASAGYLVSQFLSPLTNHRQDGYGGSNENRRRFLLELVTAVREAVGEALALTVRIGGSDLMRGGCTNAEACELAVALEAEGVDGINVTGGWHESKVPQLTADVPSGAFLPLARKIKECVKIPVIASNQLHDPATAYEAVLWGYADFVNLGRPLLADPAWPDKVRHASKETLRPCLSCNRLCLDSVFAGRPVACVVNSELCSELSIVSSSSLSSFSPRPLPERWLVVGGGAAGLTAAFVAAEAGHQVTLCEASEFWGGLLAKELLFPDGFAYNELSAYLRNRAQDAGVFLQSSSAVEDLDDLVEDYDRIIIAWGAARSLELPPGADRRGVKVMSLWDSIWEEDPPGKRWVVLGSTALACRVAREHARQGRVDERQIHHLLAYGVLGWKELEGFALRGGAKVTLVSPARKPARDAGRSTAWTLVDALRRARVRMMTGARLVGFSKQGILVERRGQPEEIPCDAVIVQEKRRPRLPKGVDPRTGSSANGRIVVVGDAGRPRTLRHALAEGEAVLDLVAAADARARGQN